MTSLFPASKTRTGGAPSSLALILFGLILAVLPPSPTAFGADTDAGDAPGPCAQARSLTLAEARTLALANDEQLAGMGQAVVGAQADIMAVNADRLPQLDVGGTWTHNLKKPVFFLPPDMAEGLGGATSLEMGGDWDLQAAATVTVNLWTAGRLSAARGMATEALSATRWQEALVADAVVLSAETAYFNALLAGRQLEIAASAMALAEENLRVTTKIFEEGKTSRYDMLRAQVELTNRETPLVSARNDMALAHQRLLRVCGLDPSLSLTLTDALDAVPDPDPLDDLLTEMIRRSPELRALEHQVRATRLSVNLAKAGRGPVVWFQGQYALQGQWDDTVFPDSGATAKSASAAVGVSLPIFDGFAAKADIRGSEADLRMAQLELDRVTRDRELGVRQLRTYLENALTALEGRHEGVDLAEEAYRLALVRLENGLATPLERLDAELALIQAQVQLAEALYTCNVAESNLKLAVGGRTETARLAEENTQ